MTGSEISPQLQAEYIATLKRAFSGPNAADYVTLDGFMGGYMRECTNWLLSQDYISFDKKTSALNSDDQYTALCYRLTPKGQEVIK